MIGRKVVIRKREFQPALSKFNFSKLNIGDEKSDELSEGTIYNHLNQFFIRINEFKELKIVTMRKKEEKSTVEDIVSDIHLIN